MANRLFVVIFLQTCLYHVIHASSYAAFANSGGSKQINRLDIRTLYPGFHSTTGFAGPYGPNTESAPRLPDQVTPSQIVSTDPVASTMGSILPNRGPSNYQTSSPWTKRPGFSTGSFIRGIFQAADLVRRPASLGLPIGLGPACGCTSRVSESGRNNFHEPVRHDESGSSFRDYSGYRNSNDYDDFASSLSGSTRYYGLGSGIGESVSSNFRSGSNSGGLDGSTNSYSGLGSNYESISSKAQSSNNFGKPYCNCDVSTMEWMSRNSELGPYNAESFSSKSTSESNLGTSYSSYDGLGNSLGEFVPSKVRPGSNFGDPYCSYGSKNYHGSTSSNESSNGSGRMVSYGGSDHGTVAVAGELPVVGRTTVAGQVPITGGVKFNGFIPASGKVTIGGSCYCGPPFVF